MSAKIEKRTSQTNLQAASNGKIVGYIPYNSLSGDLGGFQEKIAPGAFSGSLKPGKRIMAFWSHDDQQPIANTLSGSLVLRDSPMQLNVTIDTGPTTWGKDALEAVRRGDVRGLSFGFMVLPKGDKWERVNGKDIRTLINVDLTEVSPVVYPAYPDTSAAVRSMRLWKNSKGAADPSIMLGLIAEEDELFKKILGL